MRNRYGNSPVTASNKHRCKWTWLIGRESRLTAENNFFWHVYIETNMEIRGSILWLCKATYCKNYTKSSVKNIKFNIQYFLVGQQQNASRRLRRASCRSLNFSKSPLAFPFFRRINMDPSWISHLMLLWISHSVQAHCMLVILKFFS